MDFNEGFKKSTAKFDNEGTADIFSSFFLAIGVDWATFLQWALSNYDNFERLIQKSVMFLASKRDSSVYWSVLAAEIVEPEKCQWQYSE